MFLALPYGLAAIAGSFERKKGKGIEGKTKGRPLRNRCCPSTRSREPTALTPGPLPEARGKEMDPHPQP